MVIFFLVKLRASLDLTWLALEGSEHYLLKTLGLKRQRNVDLLWVGKHLATSCGVWGTRIPWPGLLDRHMQTVQHTCKSFLSRVRGTGNTLLSSYRLLLQFTLWVDLEYLPLFHESKVYTGRHNKQKWWLAAGEPEKITRTRRRKQSQTKNLCMRYVFCTTFTIRDQRKEDEKIHSFIHSFKQMYLVFSKIKRLVLSWNILQSIHGYLKVLFDPQKE